MMMSRIVLLVCLVSFCVQHVLSAAIVGIDFGTDFIKVAYVQPGKAFDIVLNENSKRKTENLLGIDRGQRVYGSNAENLLARDPDHVFMFTRDLLGATIDGPEVRHLDESLGIKYNLVEDPETGGFKILLDEGTEDEYSYRPEEIVGMILSHIRKLSNAYTGQEIIDSVITVPPFYTQVQREALLNAAEIAGLKVLTLVDENVAAAVQHGIYNEFDNETHKILVYNMGSSSTKVTLFNFYGKPGIGKNAKPNTQIDVLAKAWDKTLGGSSLDMVLTNIIADEFDKQHYGGGNGDESIRQSKRAMERIRKQACKVKTVLSANMDFPVSLESVYDGKDVRLHVTREQMEEASESLWKRVIQPIEKVLKETGTEVKDLHSIELIGGGVRVPKIKSILSSFFQGMELGSHLNGDEAKAFGAVFIGANMSTTFRVRHVGLLDITLDSVIVELSEVDGSGGDEAWNKDAVLFNASSPIPARKVVTFRHEKDVRCRLVRQVGDERVAFAEYEVKGVQEAIEKFGQFGKPKLSLTFQLSTNDTVTLVKADAVFVEEIEPPKEEEKEEQDDTAAEAATPEKPEEGGEEQQQEEEGEEKKEGEDAEKAKERENEKDGDDDDKKSKKKAAKPTKKTHRFALTLTRVDKSVKLRQIGPEAIAQARELLEKWDAKEQEKRNHEAMKNNLESFIFSSRDKVRTKEEEVDQVLSEEEKEKLFEDLMELEDWLDDEGSDAPLSELKSRRVALDKRIKRIFKNVAELDQRPATARAARKLTATIKSQIESVWPKERPWITEEEKAFVLKEVETFESWLTEAEAEQAKISLQETPVLTSGDIAQKLETLHLVMESALKRAMPKPPKKAKTTKKEEGDEKEKKSDQDDSEKTDDGDDDDDSNSSSDDGEGNSNDDDGQGMDEKDEL